MRIERIDEKTVKCYLSNEELEEYDISYKDFVMRSDKAREVVEDIIEQAEEEVGYQPPRFAFDLQIMMLPGEGMILTFSDRGPDADNPEKELADCLKNMKDYITSGGKPMFLGGEQKLNELIGNLMKLSGLSKALEFAKAASQAASGEIGNEAAGASQQVQASDPVRGQEERKKEDRPAFVVFCFGNMRSLCQYARALPEETGFESSLYCLEGYYYLFLERGDAPYELYSRACIQALEFASIYTADRDQTLYLTEHGECLIPREAVRKLRF